MNPFFEYQQQQNRRQFFGDVGLRAGGIALGMLAGRDGGPSRHDGSPFSLREPTSPHFPPKAKSLIYLHMNGRPSQMDLWDYKPQLQKHFSSELPDSVRNNQRITTMTSGQTRFPVAPSKFAFRQARECGTWIRELLPHTARIVDEIAVIKSVTPMRSITTPPARS